MNPVETYLNELQSIHSSRVGVKETTYYPALANLLNEIGKTLKPKVRCVIHPASQGAGNPDGGLFTQDQLKKAPEGVFPGLLPARGVIEVKPTSDETWVIAKSDQVSKYWRKYRQVLVTNYRDFVLVGEDEDGKPARSETFRLAESEQEFWRAAPRTLADRLGVRLTEYLKRVMLHRARLADPKDVAWFLASYARDARERIEHSDLPALQAVREALEQTLGLQFEGEKGDHFFKSTFIQTLFYGVFSAWVLWAKKHPPQDKARFNWHEAQWSLHVPMIRALYEQLATPAKLGALSLSEVLDWTGAVLNRVDRASFFASFEEGQAVQYFYEPFLEAFDPALRKELGVWYTPHEIVRYMVERVDRVLREELEIEDGLADRRVFVLDPCCGTGSYLVEVLRRIERTLKEKGGDALLGEDLKRAAMERVFGFEIIPAPFVVAHLQLGLLLQNLGAPLSEEERAGVYLTNALTGWEPPTEEGKKHLAEQLRLFPELKEESDAAAGVKRETPILVILGNPPYNAFAGVSPEEEGDLVKPYKESLNTDVSKGGWGIKKFNLDDLYVRFFRIAERRIAEMSRKGVVCFISNHSWVSEPSFVVLRDRLLNSFDRFWIENLHGNRKISEYAPDGRTSETIFSVSGFSVGIQQGVVTSLWVKSGKKRKGSQVLFRDDIDVAKAVERRALLLESLKAKNFDRQYEAAHPDRSNRYSFRPSKVSGEYRAWPKLTELCAEPPITGFKENRGFSLIDSDVNVLEERMRKYFDPGVDWKTLKQLKTSLTENAARFDAEKARKNVLAAEQYQGERLLRYVLRPFEIRWCYYCPIRPLWNEPRPSLFNHLFAGNACLVSRPAGVASPEGVPFYFHARLGDFDFIRGHSYHFPIRLRTAALAFSKKRISDPALPGTETITANLSNDARSYLANLGLERLDANTESAIPIWLHTLAIGYSLLYLEENADGIREDWPQVPLPDSKKALLASAELGKEVAALLDTEQQITGLGAREEMKALAVLSKEGGGRLQPGADLEVTAGWGHAGKEGVTMPGRGKAVPRPYEPAERAAIEKGAKALGIPAAEAFKRLGDTTLDVYLNEKAYWKNVPSGVWNYYIGGYQVIKKWLSYRESDLLGRGLSPDEARYVTEMARRIAAILLLGPALDENYRKVKEAAFDWSSLKASS